MKEEIIQFCFVGCVIAGGAAFIFSILFCTSKTFRAEVIKDWKGE